MEHKRNSIHPELIYTAGFHPNSCEEKKLVKQEYHLFDCDSTPPSEIARENVDEDQHCKIVIK